MGSLRGTTWDSRIFSHSLSLHWFLQLEVMRTYLPDAETLGWEPGVGLGLFAPRIPLLNFYPLHAGVQPAHSSSLPLLLIWMDVDSLIL